ncbi:MAG: hypothetical protein Kow0032_24600 [Methyloligellaceae bacterium]
MSMGVGVLLEEEDRAEGKTARTRPVDLVHLARHTMGNRALEREVLELFLMQSELYLERLDQAANDKAWRDAAHTIKGSARGIGAWHLASCAEQAEALKGAELEQHRQEFLDALQAMIGETNRYIRLLLTDA